MGIIPNLSFYDLYSYLKVYLFAKDIFSSLSLFPECSPKLGQKVYIKHPRNNCILSRLELSRVLSMIRAKSSTI